ncbi:MAG: M15 family metallopeptidase [Clostridia bacterium]|nr:M15 family metallopeptidase [Clostridia bacterium]
MKNRYLYKTLVFLLIALIAVPAAALSLSSCSGNDVSEAPQSEAGTSSDPGEVSLDGSSGEPSEEDSSEEEISEPEESSEDPVPMTVEEKIAAYEEYVGVKYAIDMTGFEEYVCPENEADYVFLVNPEHPLAEDYVPDDLVRCSHIREGRADKYAFMNRVADKALDAFLREAAYYGYKDITVTNAYRSYKTQEKLFNMYVSNERAKGKSKEEAIAAALTYSTRPGTSEHQSGLCCDMHNKPKASQFNGTEESRWLAANCYRFGFILRYPEGTQDITGIIYESWHFRYVGRTAATEIHNLGITLDEYCEPEKYQR